MNAYREPGRVEPTLTPEEERAFLRAVGSGAVDDRQLVRGIVLLVLLDLLAVAVFA